MSIKGIIRVIKYFLLPKMYTGPEIAEMGKSIKFDYFPEAFDIIYKSDKLTVTEKSQFVKKLLHGYSQNKYLDKRGFEYIKSKLED